MAWFLDQRREVPWRGEADPYRVWVGEVMAQQTRLSVAAPYYEEFLRRFPDIRSLALASLDDVLKAWEGLGYYARARHLHRAARLVLAEHGGCLPGSPDRLRSLPGIGAYTAGAIASLAFGHPEPAIDGNARRVLARIHDLAAPAASELDRLARQLIAAAEADAASVNQALMDLGAQICRPRRPRCDTCPVSAGCRARALGVVSQRPAPTRRPSLPHHTVAVALVWSGQRLLITRRPEEGLLGGLWELPGGKVEPGETPRRAVRRELREEMGISISVGERAGTVRHAFSHYRITLHAFHARHTGGKPVARVATDWRWVTRDELPGFAFPAATQRIIAGLTDALAVAPEGRGVGRTDGVAT